mgnify:CR=1 FL=1
MKTDLYSNGITINYQEGDTSLQRKTIVHKEDLEDKSYIIRQDDTLSSIANKFYNEPLYWYIIADVNNIDNPFILETGKSIIIPNINKYEL